MRKKNEATLLYCNKKMQNDFKFVDHLEYERHTELEVKKIANGIVHPLRKNVKGVSALTGGVTDSNFGFLELSLTKRVTPASFVMVYQDWFRGPIKETDLNSIKYVDEDVVFLGALNGHYGHFILEGLSRLWYFLNPKNAHLKAVYISEGSNERFISFFSLFGLKDQDIIEIIEPTRFRSVVIPEQSIRLHDFYHILYKKTIDRIKESVASGSSKKVFFSKQLSKGGRAIGESVIENVFKKNGYEIFHPERMTPYETVCIVKGCDEFVASSGTNIHNSIFLNDQKSVICLNRSEHIHPIQIMIDRMRGLNATYIDVFVTSSAENFGNKPCFVAMTKYLKKYFIDKEMIFSTSQNHIISFLYLLKYLVFPFHLTLFKIKRSINNVFKSLAPP